jgi:hypothetical protein
MGDPIAGNAVMWRHCSESLTGLRRKFGELKGGGFGMGDALNANATLDNLALRRERRLRCEGDH